MLQVSVGALIALGFIMLVCFILPIGLFYTFYRLSDSSFKMFGIGAAAFFTVKFVAELPVNAILEHYWPLAEHHAVYGTYLLLFCPLAFVGVNFAALKLFGKHFDTTGNVLMYGSGYTALQNVVEAGMVSFMYFITLWGIRSCGANYVVVSDADYVSMSDVVSRSNLVTESIYTEMRQLCDMPTIYFVSMCLERLWLIVVYSAVVLVIWLAARKSASLSESLTLLGIAFGMRLLAGLPTVLGSLGVISAGWISALLIIAILLADSAAAVLCWRNKLGGEHMNDLPAE